MAVACETLKSSLPLVRGRYLFDVPLSPTTWFRVGGPAQVVFKPADRDDLSFFLKNRPVNIPLYTMGVGSNLIVRDGGVEGIVIRLGSGFTNMFVDETTIDVGAAVLDRNVAMLSAQEAIGGLEFLCGIPGTIGGALRMNAGAYGSDISQTLVHAYVMDTKGKLHCLTAQDLGLSYRHCTIPKDWIFIGARMKGHRSNTADVQHKIDSFLCEREKTQPVKSRTGGSTFANPEGKKAWELIDKAGCRGLRKGGAVISELHCNFMINTGDATAADLEDLGAEVKQRVMATSKIDLRWEIERIGVKSGLVGVKAA